MGCNVFLVVKGYHPPSEKNPGMEVSKECAKQNARSDHSSGASLGFSKSWRFIKPVTRDFPRGVGAASLPLGINRNRNQKKHLKINRLQLGIGTHGSKPSFPGTMLLKPLAKPPLEPQFLVTLVCQATQKFLLTGNLDSQAAKSSVLVNGFYWMMKIQISAALNRWAGQL